jgi:hypothetical protein
MPVGTYLYLRAVGTGDPVDVPCLARGRGLNEVPIVAIREINSCRKALYGGFWKSIVSVHQQMDLMFGLSNMFFQRLNTHIYSPVTARTMFTNCFRAKKGTDGSAVGRGCWSSRRTAGKQHKGMELASCRKPYEFMPPLGGRLKAT